MINPEIEARTNKLMSIWAPLIITAAAIFFMYDNIEEMSNFGNYISTTPGNFKFLLFLCVFVLVWLVALDRKPKLKINSEGLWVRKSDFPFRKIYVIPWQNIQGFYITNLRMRRMRSKRLTIVFRNGEKDKSTEINFLDSHVNSIVAALQHYAEAYNFSDFGED